MADCCSAQGEQPPSLSRFGKFQSYLARNYAFSMFSLASHLFWLADNEFLPLKMSQNNSPIGKHVSVEQVANN